MSTIKFTSAYYVPFERATLIQRFHYTIRHFRNVGLRNAWLESYYVFEE
jgi:hypothetical protein